MDEYRSSESIRGYERFFGFHQTPFSLAPDTRFLFQSASHADAIAQVTYALERREPVVVVTGEIGAGKTLLCRTVVQRLERRTFLSIINDPLLEHDDLLKQMLQDFGVISKDRTRLTPTSRHDLVHALQEFLSSLAALHAHAVVIIDEAQHLKPDVLESIRLISNIQDERGTMLQIILVGQTDLDELVSRPELQSLKQRVSRSVHLGPLSTAEVAQYIGHRLSVARDPTTNSSIPGASELERELAKWNGADSDATFTLEAVDGVAQISRGIPRVVNLLCDRALEAAFARQSGTVDAPLIGTAAQALAMPVGREIAEDRSLQPLPPLESPPIEPSAVPAVDTPASPTVATRAIRSLSAAVLLLIAGATIWFGSRAMSQRGSGEPASPAAPLQPTTVPQNPPAVTSQQGGAVRQPTPAAAPSTPAPISQPAGSAAAAADSTGEKFEIVVASFRTAARATDVAASVAALGQPVRQRDAGGWQQVLAGPYGSSVEARDAQQRLERAGFTGTQLVPVTR